MPRSVPAERPGGLGSVPGPTQARGRGFGEGKAAAWGGLRWEAQGQTSRGAGGNSGPRWHSQVCLTSTAQASRARRKAVGAAKGRGEPSRSCCSYPSRPEALSYAVVVDAKPPQATSEPAAARRAENMGAARSPTPSWPRQGPSKTQQCLQIPTSMVPYPATGVRAHLARHRSSESLTRPQAGPQVIKQPC